MRSFETWRSVSLFKEKDKQLLSVFVLITLYLHFNFLLINKKKSKSTSEKQYNSIKLSTTRKLDKCLVDFFFVAAMLLDIKSCSSWRFVFLLLSGAT